LTKFNQHDHIPANHSMRTTVFGDPLDLEALSQGCPTSRLRSICRSFNAWQSISGDFMHV